MASMDIECSGFTFLSNFDSGNLARVELVPKKSNEKPSNPGKNTPIEEVPDFEFNIWTKPDCAGTEFENSNRTWFYFGIKGGTPFSLVKLNIVNLNRQSKMYSQGMAPVFRMVPGRSHWDRIKEKPTYTVEDDIFILSFKYRTLENIRATTYFAFTYPYSYVDLQNSLNSIDARFKNHPVGPVTLDEIYYHRECVCYSLEGRIIDLITISSHHNITPEREPRLKNLFPMIDVPRPFRFQSKKVVFVSARVHPGETPSSFVLNGLLNLLLARDDPVAILLRRLYVFKLIPMLNPDGVSQGHYRTDTRGVNLNRVYLSPDLTLHPSVYAARALICYHHNGCEMEEELKVLRAPSLESVCSEIADTNANIEHKVSHLNLSHSAPFLPAPYSPEQSQSTVDLISSVNIDEEQNNNLASTSCPVLINKKDIFASIHESILNSVGNSSSRHDCSVSVVAEGMPDKPFIFNSIPSVVDVSTAALFASESEEEVTEVVGCADVSIASSSGEASGDLGSQEDIQQPLPVPVPVAEVSATTSPSMPSTSEESGLFLYVDLHGHASKKGIFMYGNYFENAEDSIECMLLPKIMSLNSQNFHFTACNFTERNMYLRDRRDGMSREGSGRVAVLKTTGLVRSYTLECNYNTGRIVNVLPPCVKESKSNVPSLVVPPKYTPHVFEEVGRALGVSILDLTGSNPWSRIPHSEFHTLSGIRDWLRINCIPEQNYVQRVVHRPNARRPAISVQVGAMGIRPSSSKTRLVGSKRDTNLARTRRLAPLIAKSSESKVTSASVGEDSERKENLSDFQSTSCVKVTKVFPEPKENIGPCSSQRGTAVPKKLKSVQSSGGGVLKQVLAVRSKCAAVSALAGSSKLSKGNIPSGRVLGSVTVLKKGSSTPSPTKFRKTVHAANQEDFTCDEKGESVRKGLTHVNSVKSVEKLRDQTIVRQGPKRLKISPLKSENSPSVSEDAKSKLKQVSVAQVLKEKKKSPQVEEPWCTSQETSRRNSTSPTPDKVKQSTKSEKQGKSRIPHLSPVKKKTGDSGRKRGKVSLRSLATSVARLRTPSSDNNQSVQPEKKRKKLKCKFP